jgi:DNA polymerase-3 subunit delta
MLIVTATKMDGRSKTIKSFLANGPVIQCKTPYNAENLSRWIRDELRNKNIIIESPALMYLSSHIKLDYFTASNEMDKLLLYIGTEKKINLEQVRACIAVTNESNVFDLQNAIGTREIHKALSLIEKMDNFQEIGVMTITLLSRYFQLIWSIHLLRKRDIMDDEIINTHLNSAPRFFRPDYIRSANKYSLQETKKVLSLLFNCDKDLKSLNSDPKVIFTKLVCDICS